jgi:hypothetical protein
LEALDGGRQSAISRQSGRYSSFQVCLPWFLGSSHSIGGILFSSLIGPYAAVGAIHDAESMRFERPMSESTGRSTEGSSIKMAGWSRPEPVTRTAPPLPTIGWRIFSQAVVDIRQCRTS